ncbi:borealin-2 isoform X2 [Polypterus senegalus]|uniref:borealin-2 isoform X2 n=1 Tax=Polypterus senegalus TaxID=55291 RepID=UPI0019658343|nr:borealin-2 isoform X2 [Polypterus senegalus]
MDGSHLRAFRSSSSAPTRCCQLSSAFLLGANLTPAVSCLTSKRAVMARRRIQRREQMGDEELEKDLLETRDQKIRLFLQQFENEAKQKRCEQEKYLETLVTSAQKTFKVEILKMPYSLQKTLLKDVTEKANPEVMDIFDEECPQMKTVKAKRNRKDAVSQQTPSSLKRTLSVQHKHTVRSFATPSSKAKSLADLHSTKKKVQQLPRSATLNRDKGYSSLPLCINQDIPFANIPTSKGQPLCLFDKNDVNFDLIDKKALQHMQELMRLGACAGNLML